MRRWRHAIRLISLAALFCAAPLVLRAASASASATPALMASDGAFITLAADTDTHGALIDDAAAQDGGDAQGRVRRPPDKGASPPPKSGERAVPRDQAKPRNDAPPRGDDRNRPPRTDHREPPRRSDVPPRYFAVPHVYAFEPIDMRIGFYYHPYFGFYVGPYYGPFYPYPGPFPPSARYAVSSLRLKVTPADATVYLNGYYAGIVDDFDGIFQRLYVPAGGHHLEFRLEGYESWEQDVYVAAGDSLEITHQMVRLTSRSVVVPPPVPRPVPEAWQADPRDLDEPASPYGILTIHVDPADAQIVIDDESWSTTPGQHEFVIHLPEGAHQIEVRKAGYRTFVTSVELSHGQTTPLNVRLDR